MAQNLIAIAMPILKDKYQQWQQFTQKLNTEYREQFYESRKKAGVHERTFLQHTPDQDLVIVTLEGNDPMGAFQKMFSANDQYTNWFVQQVKDVHGVDLRQPLPGPAPEQIVDSDRM